MTIERAVRELERLSGLVDAGEFQPAYEGCIALLDKVSEELKENPNCYILLFNLAGLLIDVGGMHPNADATSAGLWGIGAWPSIRRYCCQHLSSPYWPASLGL